MHGTIFVELKKYVEAKLGTEAWPGLLKAVGFDGRRYEALDEYPDADAVKLVTTASTVTGLEAGAILEDFGDFIAPRPARHVLGAHQSRVEDARHRAHRDRGPRGRPAQEPRGSSAPAEGVAARAR
jgi:hypothetical protein